MGAILLSCMEVSYYTTGFFRSYGCQAISLTVLQFSGRLKSGKHIRDHSVKQAALVIWADCTEYFFQKIRRYNSSPLTQGSKIKRHDSELLMFLIATICITTC